MHHLFEMADGGEHGQHHFDQYALIPLKRLAHLQAVRIAALAAGERHLREIGRDDMSGSINSKVHGGLIVPNFIQCIWVIDA